MYPIILITLLKLLFIGALGKEDEQALELITKLITGYGYPVEIHEIQTKDGYFLNIHRIPNGKIQFNQSNDKPVLIVHGMGGGAENFVWLGAGKSLGFELADHGYDVWLMNARGTWHSLKHKTLDSDKDDDYWKFSWHEIGIYDTPAAIDFILDKTNKKSLHYIGHSQGTTTLFAMGSERESYNDKIKVMIALGPASVNLKLKNELVNNLLPYYKFFQLLYSQLNLHRALPFLTISEYHKIAYGICGQRFSPVQLCRVLLFQVSGIEYEQFDSQLFPLLTMMGPAGLSVYQVIHYAQTVSKGKFDKYDFGEKENLEKYGSTEPPEYNITRCTFPVALFYAENDVFVSKEALENLVTYLPNIVEIYKIPYEMWTHIDMIWGRDVNKLLNPRILEVMEKYD